MTIFCKTDFNFAYGLAKRHCFAGIRRSQFDESWQTKNSIYSNINSILWLFCLIMSGIGELVKASLRKTNAHGLARPVNEKQLYIRVLWLIMWLVVSGLFIWYFVKFFKKFQANDIISNIKADSVPFEYPDFYFCYDYMMSGTRHQYLTKKTVAFINSSFQRSEKWCRENGIKVCKGEEVNIAEVQINSLPFRFLADNMAHVLENSIHIALKFRNNGDNDQMNELIVTEFYHPTHLRCFKAVVNITNKKDLRFTGHDDGLLFALKMDLPVEEGSPQLPVIKISNRNLTAPHWAFDTKSLVFESVGFRDPKVILYMTQPMHYPSSFDRVLSLEGGRKYNVQLEMKEKVHNKDTSQCIDKHPDVQMVNPYDNSPYTVKYNYAICYYRAVQAQFKREFNATCPYLPHPWPATDHSLYNLSSGWGSQQDVEKYSDGSTRLQPEEPLEKCAAQYPCTQRSYIPIVESVSWSSLSIKKQAGNISQQELDYLRSNILKLQVSASKPMADQIIFTRAYNFESFVADVGGILGICLGMSLLTAFELAQFFHDLAVLLLCSKEDTHSELEMIGQRDPAGSWENPNI